METWKRGNVARALGKSRGGRERGKEGRFWAPRLTSSAVEGGSSRCAAHPPRARRTRIGASARMRARVDVIARVEVEVEARAGLLAGG